MSKLAKFRNSPANFFADSKSSFVRTLVGALASAVFDNDLVMDLLEDPSDALGRSGLPGIAELSARQRRHSAGRRQELIRKAGTPTISVIMAAYNAEDTIVDALHSVLGQTHRALEVIVVDDASSDRTVAAVEAMNDTRVQVVSSATQQGAAKARNWGLATSSGDYLTFHDADDTAHPEKLERQLAALLAKPEAIICTSNFRRSFPNGQRAIINGRRFAKSVISMLIPRDPVFTKLGYMLDLRIGEDTEYYKRILTVFGRDREIHLYQTLYWARFTIDSLLFSNCDTIVEGNRVNYKRSPEVEEFMEIILERMRCIEDGRLDAYVAG